MPDVVTGYRSGNTTFNQNQKITQMHDTILELKPANYPLTAILERIAKLETRSAKFEWLEDERMPHWDAINKAGGYAAGDTSIVVDNGTYFEAGMTCVFPRTGEVFRVTAVSTNTLTIVRGSGAAAVNDDEAIMILGDGNEEGATSKDAKQTVLTNLYNYTQIFRTPVAITRTEQKTAMYGTNDELDRQRAKRAVEHQEKIERAFWWGKRAIITTGTHPLRFTGGIFEFITSNITDFNGMMTEYDFDKFCETALQYGTLNKLAFCGARPISVINGFAKDKLEVVDQAKKEFGLYITKYISPHGDINLVKHPMFTGDVYGYYMACLDMDQEAINYQYLTDSDTMLKENIQAPDVDGQKDEYLTECGLFFSNEKDHSLGTDIKS